MSETEADLGEDEDELLTVEDAFQLGSVLQYIRQAGSNQYNLLHAERNVIYDGMIEVENTLKRVNIAVSVASEIEDLRRRFLESYIDHQEEGSYYREGEEIDSLQISENDGGTLANKARTWSRIVHDSVSKQKQIPVETTPIVDTEIVMDGPEVLFDEGVWERLTTRIQEDIRESSRALAAGCPTASVILSLRTVEDLLREWYKQELATDEVDEPWGPVLEKLERELDDNGGVPAVLSNLKYLKEKRNEVNHPDKSPNTREAATTLTMIPETLADIDEQLG